MYSIDNRKRQSHSHRGMNIDIIFIVLSNDLIDLSVLREKVKSVDVCKKQRGKGGPKI